MALREICATVKSSIRKQCSMILILKQANSNAPQPLNSEILWDECEKATFATF